MSSSRYISGVAWSALNAAASVLLPLGIFIFFARALSPTLIGVVALGVACTEILKTMGMPGFYESLLQQKDDLERCHETAAFTMILAGTGLIVVYLALIQVLAWHMPDVAEHRLGLDLIGLRIVIDLAAGQPQAAPAQ